MTQLLDEPVEPFIGSACNLTLVGVSAEFKPIHGGEDIGNADNVRVGRHLCDG